MNPSQSATQAGNLQAAWHHERQDAAWFQHCSPQTFPYHIDISWQGGDIDERETPSWTSPVASNFVDDLR